MPLTDRVLDGLRRWTQVTEHGVVIEDVQVSLKPELLLPRVVLRGVAEVREMRDVMCIGAVGSRNDWLTVTFRPELQLTTGCFTGSLDDFERLAANGKMERERAEYAAAIAFIRVLARYRG